MATVLVTGAGKGIGRATALLLDNKGYTVVAGVRSSADGESLRAAASPRMRVISLDITDATQISQAAQTVDEATGKQGLDGLINNAGIAVPAPLEFLPIDEFRRQIEVNLTAQLAITQALLPQIRLVRGRIINVSSIGGRIAGKMLGAYHASKFAMEGLTDTLRQELASWQIHVVSIEPGAIATPIWESGAATADRLIAQMPAQVQAMYGKAIAGTRANAARSAKEGLPPERVAAVIAMALTARTPRTRYTVGTDAAIGAQILARLPDRVRDRLMSRLL